MNIDALLLTVLIGITSINAAILAIIANLLSKRIDRLENKLDKCLLNKILEVTG